MFQSTESPTGHFTLLPFPDTFHELPNPFGVGGLLILNKFGNESARILPAHMTGILTAAAQARSTFGPGSGVCECYGVTDRRGSEEFNKALSTRRAEQALSSLLSAMALSDESIRFSNGLGERFAEEYFGKGEGDRNDAFRGVLCYLWESFSTATDPFLKINVAAAGPPLRGEGEGRRRTFLAALHMGRHRAQPRSPFA